ncbi:MAG: ketoacyl-ACP synthase III [Spirochaetes bacterium]|nr:ketoacyl-ACP synthase III [Spirochaetota bacterium]
MVQHLKHAYIAGTGYYVPKKVLTNKDLEKIVDTSDEWITTRTGIKERRIAAREETTSVIGAKAAKQALKAAGIKADELDLIITATITPDMPFPATSALIQNIIGACKAGVVDIEAACSGYIYAISMANQFIRTGEYKNILIVASEILSRITDWEDRNTCVLFGDAAGAAVIRESQSKSEIIAAYLGGDGAYKDLLYLPGGGSLNPVSKATIDKRLHYIKMKGNETFKVAVTQMSLSAEKVLEKAGMTKKDVSLLVPHQANLRIIQAVQKRLELPDDKVYINVNRYGNTSAATIAVAIAEAVQEGKVKKGDIILFVAFGGGFTWASALIRW